MKYLHKRLLPLLLAIFMVMSTPIQSFADMIGGTGTASIPTVKPGGSGYLNNPDPIFRDYGFRVTFGSSAPMDGVVDRLTGAYTDADLDAQRAEIMNINKTRYWEPGNAMT